MLHLPTVISDDSCIVLGGGGHAKVVIDCMLAAGFPTPIGILDARTEMRGLSIMGVPVLGSDDLLPELCARGLAAFAVGIGGSRDNLPRARIFELGLGHGLRPVQIRHPWSYCSASAKIGPGSALMAFSAVNAEASVGADVIVNSGAIVEHECDIRDHVHIATGARLGGRVKVGSYAHIGAGATVLQGVVIGDAAIVGAGAVVRKAVDPGTIVVGVPARLIAGADQGGNLDESLPS